MKSTNELYPVFLKVNQLNFIIIGGGKVALEKLGFLLKSSPRASVKLVSNSYLPELIELANKFDVELIEDEYSSAYLVGQQFMIAATNNMELNTTIRKDAKKMNIPINVADTPDLCDFYLGGIVSKGNIKIAISTNGKSPTLAKRLREFLEQLIPHNVDELALSLNQYRKQLKNDFELKVKELDQITKDILPIKKYK
ncbi:MAG: bifunctional precorrin-2 dehydrogenase/sirohydrochlorin ferrochelatase [Flavobacteriales bacterium]|nr:bifunctional precorrin-2 dehydrogenase/sirohydrochlorin ferrochelatase [Flavobacteriales bacterium]